MGVDPYTGIQMKREELTDFNWKNPFVLLLYIKNISALLELNSCSTFQRFNPLTDQLFNVTSPHLKLCLADAIHNFKWGKIIQIWQNVAQLFWNLADRCHV